MRDEIDDESEKESNHRRKEITGEKDLTNEARPLDFDGSDHQMRDEITR